MLRSHVHGMTSLLRRRLVHESSARFCRGHSIWGFAYAVTFVLLAFPCGVASGATFRITPKVDVSESYTDNVRAVSEGAEADLITETQAGANFFADGNRLDLNLDLAAINESHLDTNGLNSTRPQILGIGSIELFKDHLFIDSSISLSETSTLRGGAISARDRSLPSNRTRQLLFDVAPRYEQRLGRWLDATLQYSHSESRFSEPSAGVTGVTIAGLPPTGRVRDQKMDRASMLLDTGQHFSRISSQLEFSSETNKRGSAKLTEERVDLANEYRLNRHVGLIARAGYEDVSDPDPSLASTGPTWAIGAHLQPGPRLDFRTEIGRKYDASNVAANLTYEISSFYVLTASFEQAVRTQQEARLNRLNSLITGADGGLIDPTTGIFRDPAATGFDLDNSSFREDLFRLGLTGTRGRNTVNFLVDLSNREFDQATAKEEQLDVRLNVRRRLQPKLTGSVGLNYSDVLTSRTPGTGDTRYQGDATLSYRLGEIFTSRVEYSHLQRSSDAGRDTSENIVLLGLRAVF